MAIIPAITGLGLITPLGRSAQTTFDALLAGRFISTHSRIEANAPRAVSLAIEAADEAIAQAGWNTDRENIAVVACTSKGSIESWINAPHWAETARLCFGLSDLSSHLANHIGSSGLRLCLSAACASGLHGLIRAAMMIQSGEADRVLVVAAEASVHPLFLASFQRLGVFPKPGELCRPFDQNRNGFLMSEAAAAVCLEATDDRSRIIASVDRFAFGGDATHLTGNNPDGIVLRNLLRKVLTNNSQIDLIHAHGTGTDLNDSTELAALESVLPMDCKAKLYSHKGALGHSLGASGLVAVAIDCLCRQQKLLPGNINTNTPIPSRLRIEQKTAPIAENPHSLIHAAGFGGPIALVVLKP